MKTLIIIACIFFTASVLSISVNIISMFTNSNAEILDKLNEIQVINSIRYCEAKSLDHTTHIDYKGNLAIECSKTISVR